MRKRKSYAIENEILDERGRFTTAEEFRILLGTFKDHLDPRRLAYALSFCAGLRTEDAVSVKLTDFDPTFLWLKKSQCKPHKSMRDGVIHIKRQPRFVPLPLWLSEDLKSYVQYRQMVAYYGSADIKNPKLFPRLSYGNMHSWINKLRLRHSNDYPFLKEVYRIERGYDINGNILYAQKNYRVALHCGRGFYATSAYDVTNRDIAKTRALTGHQKVDNVIPYIKNVDIMAQKEEIRKRHMDGLNPVQKTPLLIGQMRLDGFGLKNPIR